MNESYYADLKRLTDLAMGYRSAKPLLAALHYDLFTVLETEAEPARLARRLGLDEGALRRVLDALTALGWLVKKEGRYANTRSGRRLLVSGSPGYVGNNLRYQEYTWDAWSDLREVMRTGRPRAGLRQWIRKEFFTADYLKAMGDITRGPARELARRLDLRGVARTLDVGSGAGNFSAAFVEREPRLVATLLDLPEALRVTRNLTKGLRGSERLRYKAADYKRDELGRGEYDLVLISNVARVEDASTVRDLVAKAFRALRPGGRLVVHDYVISEDRTAPSFSALLNVHLLVFTGRGAAYTRAEFSGWMRDAGFAPPRSFPIGARSPFPSVALVARKPGRPAAHRMQC